MKRASGKADPYGHGCYLRCLKYTINGVNAQLQEHSTVWRFRIKDSSFQPTVWVICILKRHAISKAFACGVSRNC